MKTVLSFSVCIFFISLFSGYHPIMGENISGDALIKKRINGYISLDTKLTSMNEQFAFINGARGAFLFNHSIAVGGGLWTNLREVKGNPPNSKSEFGITYSGLIAEYNIFPENIIHFSIGIMIGGGLSAFHNVTEIPASFFIFEPEILMEIHLTYNIRMGLGAGYRFINGINLPGADDGDAGGISGNIIFKFGLF
jgi:hypothetical protein